MNHNVALAVKYRPTTFDDLVEQDSIKKILTNQIESKTFKQAYLFVGPAGCGKTTTARIFANEINGGVGTPIEIDAASHGNVDDIRELSVQAKLKPLECEYKVFIIDECHCLSSAGWSAMLKLIEEPPTTAIFILATTDVQKIPKTILSRCQRFDFHKISFAGIGMRLEKIISNEFGCDINYFDYSEGIAYIAKLADGGMRDALTLTDKALAYSSDLTLDNVIMALGTVDYSIMFDLTRAIQVLSFPNVVSIIEDIYADGKDLKLFIKQYLQFLLDVYKIMIGCSWKYVQLIKTKDTIGYIDKLDAFVIKDLIDTLLIVQNEIKYSNTPKYDIEARLLLFIEGLKQDEH